MHHLNGCGVTPAYKDGVLYATMGDKLYAFDALMKSNDEGIKDQPESGDRHDILWTCTTAAKRCMTSATFHADSVILNTSEGLEFYPARPKDVTNVERLKILKTAGTEGGATAHNGKIIVAASREGHVAFDLATDKELWKAPSGSGSTPAIDGTGVFFSDAKGSLWCLDLATGEQRWKIDGGFSDSPAGPAVSNGVVYMASNKPGAMNAIDAKSGEKIWTWGVPDKTTGVSSEDYANAVYAAPMVADGRVFFTSYTGYLYCLRAEKAPKERLAWKEKISDKVCMTVPMVHEGAVFVRGAGSTYKFAGK